MGRCVNFLMQQDSLSAISYVQVIRRTEGTRRHVRPSNVLLGGSGSREAFLARRDKRVKLLDAIGCWDQRPLAPIGQSHGPGAKPSAPHVTKG